VNTCQGTACLGTARFGRARSGSARHGMDQLQTAACRGGARRGWAGHGGDGLGTARLGAAWQGLAWSSTQLPRGKAWRGPVGLGSARLGLARHGKPWAAPRLLSSARHGVAGRGVARQGVAVHGMESIHRAGQPTPEPTRLAAVTNDRRPRTTGTACRSDRHHRHDAAAHEVQRRRQPRAPAEQGAQPDHPQDREQAHREENREMRRLEWTLALYTDGEQVIYPTANVARCLKEAGKVTKQGTQISRGLSFDGIEVPLGSPATATGPSRRCSRTPTSSTSARSASARSA
jgi:hypothetical protein